MKILKKAIAATAALTLCLSLGFSALADDDDDALYAGKTWEEVVDRVLEECDVSRDHITAGYCNLVTGEEHYINGDEYKTAASMYKLPLNMYFTDLIQSGQFDWDSYYPNVTYEYVRDASLIYSDNDWSMFLWSSSVIGGYSKFRELTAPYMGVDLNDVPDNYYSDNIYTARQFINCLKLLYNEQDRFPGIIETMQQTEQERFFMLREPRFKIAHKYGYISENGHSFMNDCGLAFTSQPIALVMFTDNVDNAEELLTAYCTAVCEYTNYTVANPPATPTPEPTAVPTPTVPAVTASADPTPVSATPESKPAKTATPFAAFLFIALFLAGGVIGAIKLKKKYNASLTLTLITVLLCAAGMLLAVAGCFGGTVIAKPTGEPQDAVTGFFDSLIAGNYTVAYDRVRDYTSLGLENEPSTESGKMAYAALHASYGYELIGSAEVDKLDAAQKVSFTYLSLPALEAAVADETQTQLKHLVQQLPSSEVYDQNNNYLPEVTERAYLQALELVLEHAADYYTTEEISLALNYTDGRWQLIMNNSLLKALNGGAGY